MTSKSKLTPILLILLISNPILCENFLKPVQRNHNASVISKVLHDVADKFLVKQNLLFDVILMPPFSQDMTELSGCEILQKKVEFCFLVEKFEVQEGKICKSSSKWRSNMQEDL